MNKQHIIIKYARIKLFLINTYVLIFVRINYFMMDLYKLKVNEKVQSEN